MSLTNKPAAGAPGDDLHDFVGYGEYPPQARWPDRARVAVQFVINYEEGGDSPVPRANPAADAFLPDASGAPAWPGQDRISIASMREYGARAGFWRLWRLFTARKLPVTVFGVASALQRSPSAVAAMRRAGWEVASHGLKWNDFRNMSEVEERADMAEAIGVHAQLTGERPLGWYTGRCSAQTLKAVLDDGGFAYSSDSYADDLPYWVNGPKGPHLIVPFRPDTTDLRFIDAQKLGTGTDFFAYLRDTFDVLYDEGNKTPKMMSVGLHCWLTGQPGRAASLVQFLDHITSHKRVWVATRIEIARHWYHEHKGLAAAAPRVG